MKTARKRKQAIQTSITAWVTDEDNVSPTTQMNPVNTPPIILSPILSQPRGSEEKNVPAKEPINSPISDVLNLAASASSLRQDIATCEMIISEKHTFLVSMLDGMDQKVADIGEKLLALESRVQTLEKKQNLRIQGRKQDI